MFLCDGRGDPDRERRYLRTLLSRRVDGIIVAARRVDPRPPVGSDLPVPVVYAMAQSEDRQDLSVLPDDEGGGFLAVHHLVKTGRSNIAHISGPEHFEAARRRARGATAAMADAGQRSGRGRGVVRGVERGLGQTGRRPLVGAASRAWTPFFAAATKSRAVLRMSCANGAGGSPKTWPSSASTTGT